MNRFDKAAIFAKWHEMDLPPKVKGLKLLHNVGLSEQDMKLVSTKINFKKKEEVYKQAKKGLSKYLRNGSSQAAASPAIKLEMLTAEQIEQVKEALTGKGWSRRGGGVSRGAGRGRGGGGYSAGVKKKENLKDTQGNIMKYPSCQSIRHHMDAFPKSSENMKKFCKTVIATAKLRSPTIRPSSLTT